MSTSKRVLKTSLLFLGLALLHGCGGGGGGDPAGGGAVPTAEAPPAVTQKIPATGGSITAALADGAQVVLTFPAGAVAADVDITVTPSVPASGDWLSFQLSPGTEVLLKPVTLTVTPPAGLDATQLPQLRLGSAADPLWLISKTNADGTLEAILPALPLPSVAAGARAVARTTAAAQFAALAPLAPADATATTITGDNFLVECELSQTVIDDATIVLDRATESDLILKVINLLANIKSNCGVSVSTQGLLEQFASDASLRQINATTFFSGLDYTSSENFVSFAPRLRRALSWCRVAQLLNAQPIACPNVPDFQLSFSQLIVGISNVASATDELYELRNQYKKVLPLAAEAAAFGADNAEEFLRRLSADVAEVLIKRAYAICNHGDLYDFLLMTELGAPSNYSADTLRNNLALCGTRVVARVFDNMNQPIPLNERTLLPGGVDDVRPDRNKTTTVLADGSLALTITGRATSCSRVIGSPLGADEMVVKVGTTELQRFFHNSGDFNGQFNLSKAELLAKLGKPADSKDPIDIEVWREHVVVPGCADENDVAFSIVLPDVRLYTLTVNGGIVCGRSRLGTVQIVGSDTKNIEDVESISGSLVFTFDAATVPTAIELPCLKRVNSDIYIQSANITALSLPALTQASSVKFTGTIASQVTIKLPKTAALNYIDARDVNSPSTIVINGGIFSTGASATNNSGLLGLEITAAQVGALLIRSNSRLAKLALDVPAIGKPGVASFVHTVDQNPELTTASFAPAAVYGSMVFHVSKVPESEWTKIRDNLTFPEGGSLTLFNAP